MSNSLRNRKPLPVVSGTTEIVSVGIRALEALPTFLNSLSDDATVSEIQIWENTAITATIWNDLVHSSYGWNGERWVEVTYDPATG